MGKKIRNINNIYIYIYIYIYNTKRKTNKQKHHKQTKQPKTATR